MKWSEVMSLIDADSEARLILQWDRYGRKYYLRTKNGKYKITWLQYMKADKYFYDVPMITGNNINFRLRKKNLHD